jgi:hypothetical protein
VDMSDVPTLLRVLSYLLIVALWIPPIVAVYRSSLNGSRRVLLLTLTALISWPICLALMALYSVCFDVIPRDFWFIAIGVNVTLAWLVLRGLHDLHE